MKIREPYSEPLTDEEQSHLEHLVREFTPLQLAHGWMIREKLVDECESLMRVVADPDPRVRPIHEYLFRRSQRRAEARKEIGL